MRPVMCSVLIRRFAGGAPSLLQQQRRNERTQRDDDVLGETGIRTLRSKPVFTTPDVFAPEDFEQCDVADDPDQPAFRETLEPQHCYICKIRYHEVHHFYDQLCPSCAALNYAKRGELADMAGMVVLLTGGRVKIGYQAGIKLLRRGAALIVTTRFPRDARRAVRRGARLRGLGRPAGNLRAGPAAHPQRGGLLRTPPRTRTRLIHHQQCVPDRAPTAGFYEHMMEPRHGRRVDLPASPRKLRRRVRGRSATVLSAARRRTTSCARTPRGHRRAGLTQAAELPRHSAARGPTPTGALFPAGQLDQDLQQVDLRDRNSWRLQLARSVVGGTAGDAAGQRGGAVRAERAAEAVDARRPGGSQHIVQRVGGGGAVLPTLKTTRHPHTNMAKAALNMMTRTSAADYQDRASHEQRRHRLGERRGPGVHRRAKTVSSTRSIPPLDIVDGAARIVDPIIDGFEHRHSCVGPVPQGLHVNRLVAREAGHR